MALLFSYMQLKESRTLYFAGIVVIFGYGMNFVKFSDLPIFCDHGQTQHSTL